MKIAKVIPCFPYTQFRRQGQGTNGSINYEVWLKTFTNVMHQETTVDTGVDTDVFLYYRFVEGDDLGKADIYKYHLSKTKNGTVFVDSMENDASIGFSTIKTFLDTDIAKEYDFLLYQEDDIQILTNSDGYLKEAVELIRDNWVIAFSVAVIKPIIHIGGFFGLIPMKPLLDNLDKFPEARLMDNEVEINRWALDAVGITSIKEVKYLEKYDNRPENLEHMGIFKQHYVIPFWKEGDKFLFKVGPT